MEYLFLNIYKIPSLTRTETKYTKNYLMVSKFQLQKENKHKRGLKLSLREKRQHTIWC